MRKKLTTAKTPIHNPNKVRKEIEYLMQFSPNRTKIQGHLNNQDLKEFKSNIEKQYPVKIAAAFSKSKAKKIAERYLLKSERKWARKYFKKARDLVHGKYGFKTSYGKRQRKVKLTYSEYINSSIWSGRKNSYYKKHKKLCVACGSAIKIHLHHMIYTAFNGTEPDNNLVTLCDEHHAAFHSQYGSSGNMKASTYAFIDEVKQLLEFPKVY